MIEVSDLAGRVKVERRFRCASNDDEWEVSDGVMGRSVEEGAE